MKTLLRIALIVIVVAAVAGGVFMLLPKPQAASAQQVAPTAAVTRGSIEETIGATGNVAPVQQASLTFGANGQIATVLVQEGQHVKAGQALAELDTTSLQWAVTLAQAQLNTADAQLTQAQQPATAADMAAAEAAVASAEAGYANVKAGPTASALAAAQAAMDSAKATLQQAQAAYDQVKDRPDVAMLPQSLTLQNATIAYQKAVADFKSASAPATPSALAAAAAQVAQAKASLAQLQAQPNPKQVAVVQSQVQQSQLSLQQAQTNLANATLVAPFDGTVLTVNVVPGDSASAATPAMILGTTDKLVVNSNVDEVDLGQIAVGQTVHLVLDAFPGRSIDGTVAFIAPAATTVNGQVAYAVEIAFNPGNVPVRVGMSATVNVVVRHADGALLAPIRAVTADRQAGKYYVTRQQPDGSTQRLEVRIGLRDSNNIQIVQGVNEGDRLVLPVVPASTTSTTQQGNPFRFLGGGGGAENRPSGGQGGFQNGSQGGSTGGTQGGTR